MTESNQIGKHLARA